MKASEEEEGSGGGAVGVTVRYFTPMDVSLHSTADDLWLSAMGDVYNLTELAHQHQGSLLLRPILVMAGRDVSHWFDRETRDIKYHIDWETQCRVPYTPEGRFVDVPPSRLTHEPLTDKHHTPWWRDERLIVGRLTHRTRWIRVINMLTFEETRLEVCSEETLSAIRERYKTHNSHAESYTWRSCDGRQLDMSATLEGNGLPDHIDHLDRLHLTTDHHSLPALLLYFNDDLTVA